MLLHSCWSIIFNMLSGLDLNSKGSKNHLEMELENRFGKEKGNSFSIPSLLQFRPVGHFFPYWLTWPLAQLSPRRPNSPRQPASPARPPSLRTATAAARSSCFSFLGQPNTAGQPPPLPPFSLSLIARARTSAPSPTSCAPRARSSTTAAAPTPSCGSISPRPRLYKTEPSPSPSSLLSPPLRFRVHQCSSKPQPSNRGAPRSAVRP